MNHYLLVGAGGTASYLFAVLYKFLREEHGDDFILAAMDADTVKTENLARQNHGEGSIGLNKAVSLVGKTPQTVAVPEYLGPKNIERVIQDGTTVIITVDNTSARKRIEDHVNKLDNAIVVNAGNEIHTSSVQLWIRKDGKNITPPLSFLHPEIAFNDKEDRPLLSCEDIDALAGGGQTAIANHASALGIMMALNHRKSTEIQWHELHMDALSGEVERIDYRESIAWTNFSSSSDSLASSEPSEPESSGLAITPPVQKTRNTTESSSRPTTR